MTTYIIYHQVKPGIDCPDGICAAAISKLKHTDAELFPDSYKDNADYGDIPQATKYPFFEDNLIIVDFSYPANWLKYWESVGCKVTVIDHHAPKFPMLSGFSGAILDANECGATLTWKHFFPDNPMPSVLTHVRRRDIGADGYYDGLCRDSEAITEAIAKLRQDWKEQSVRGVQNLLKLDNCTELLEIGNSLLDERDAIVNKACERAELVILEGHKVSFVKTTKTEDRFVSNIGNVLCRLHPDLPFAWVMSEDGKSSLRSLGFDVSKVANKLGGGGHARASGFVRQVEIVKAEDNNV